MGLQFLPPELLQLLFLKLTTPSFIQLTLTCRRCFEVALSARQALLYHLHCVPGHKLGLEDLQTAELFWLLRRRAAQNLYGINFSADCLTYPYVSEAFENGCGANINPSASEFCTQTMPNLAIAYKDKPIIRLYDVSGVGIYAWKVLHLNPSMLGYQWDGELKIIKTRLHPADEIGTRTPVLSVLHTFFPRSGKSESEMTWRELEAWREAQLGLHGLLQVTFDVIPNVRRAINFPLRPQEAYKPISVAVENRVFDDKWTVGFAVLWTAERTPVRNFVDNVRDRYQLMDSRIDWYMRSGPLEPHERPWRMGSQMFMIDIPKHLPVAMLKEMRIRDISFAKKQGPDAIARYVLLVHSAGSLFHDLSLTEHDGIWDDRLNADPSYMSVADGRHFHWRENTGPHGDKRTRLGLPFILAKPQPSPGRYRHLALGLTTIAGCPVAAIYRSRQRPWAYTPLEHLVEHTHFFQPNPNSYVAVARLWGFRPPPSNKPNMLVMSPNVTRIVLADWNRIFIWSLEPTELVEPSDYGGATDRSGFRTASRKAYYEQTICRELNDAAPIALIRPIVLTVEDGAVIHHLGFANKGYRDFTGTPLHADVTRQVLDEANTLVVTTDRGISIYYLGACANKHRETRQLPLQRGPAHELELTFAK